MTYGSLVMSYNMMDMRLYEKVDCKVEQHYHRKFAQYQKYQIRVPRLPDKWTIEFELIMEENEANNPEYAEIVIEKTCTISYKNLYGSNPLDKFVKGLDALLNPYYIVEWDGLSDYIILTAKVKGKVPSIQTPAIEIYDMDVKTIQAGKDTEIYVMKPNEVHLPRTTMGSDYKVPKVGDIIYIVDSVKSERDRTFIRTITDVEEKGKCTCDILTLNLPIDRLNNDGRVDGIGLQSPAAISNNYTASFDKTQIWRRKDNFKELLAQGNPTGQCAIPIGNHMNMKPVVKEIMSHLDYTRFEYFGAFFHWKEFEDLLKPFHDVYGEYLMDELNVLKSSNERPDYLLHIDYDEEQKDKPVVGSFTWPALNCTPDTTTVWYECLKNGERIYTHGRQDVVITDQSLELNEIDRYVFDTDEFNAIVLKHNDWHTVYNESNKDQTRMLLQWRFKPDLTWEEICTIVSKAST